jgi:hypothetical protein
MLRVVFLVAYFGFLLCIAIVLVSVLTFVGLFHKPAFANLEQLAGLLVVGAFSGCG